MIYTFENLKYLMKSRKLILICDLDETLVSTINMKSHDVHYDSETYGYFHFPYQGDFEYYCLKKRVNLRSFLSRMNEMFELHLMSAGEKQYVRKCVDIIDPEHEYFGDRIVSREEIVNGNNKAQTKLNMFPLFNDMIISIDDRVDVWANSESVVQIKPFKHAPILKEFMKKSSDYSEFEIRNHIKQHLIDTENENDDQLLMLQNALENIHKEFFKSIDRVLSGDKSHIPDVRNIMKEKRNIGILNDRNVNKKDNFTSSKLKAVNLSTETLCKSIILA